ncbi:MAG: NifU N-terminal domain-containing protein [Myxococcales bacterium]
MPILGIDQTPNPNAVKITFDRQIAPKATTFTSAQAAEHHPIAHAILKVEGVASVFIVNNFATVTRKPTSDWAEIAPKLQIALTEIGE